MKNYLIAERYANGLSASLSKAEDAEMAAQTLAELGQLFESNHDLHSVLANPVIDVDKRAAVLAEILEKEGAQEAVRRLVDALLRRGRITLVGDVARVFSMLVDERLNRVIAAVCTAEPLDENGQARLNKALTQYSGKEVRMECRVEPEILGGVVTHIGGAVIDGSVRTRLEQLRASLL